MTSQQEADVALAKRQTQKVSARYLQVGDVVGSGETVSWIGVGARTPRGKVEVQLEHGGHRRVAIWNASTLIGIERGAR